MGLSLVKAGMIMAYFMHLKFDRPGLSWLLVVPLVACILIMVGYFFPDSFRILEYGVARIQ
jgi:cytochrome c oxidase subunit IV